MGLRIANVFQYISNKMQRYTVYLYLETALHVSGGTSNHHQERIQLYIQHLVFVTPLLLSAAIVEELEPVPTLPRYRTDGRTLTNVMVAFRNLRTRLKSKDQNSIMNLTQHRNSMFICPCGIVIIFNIYILIRCTCYRVYFI
jgi:hypothetical protein